MQDVSKMLSVLTIMGGLVVFGVETYQPTETPDLVKSVGVLETFNVKDRTIATNHGSGVFISPTKFLTAAHVTNPMKNPEAVSKIRMENGDTYGIVGEKRSPDLDVTIVSVDRPYKGHVPNISCKEQKRGTELTTIGNPLSIEFVEAKVRAAGGRPIIRVAQNENIEPQDKPNTNTKKFIRIPPGKIGPIAPPPDNDKANLNGSALFQGVSLPGQSGSPIFDRDGNVVGVLAITIIDDRIGSFSGLGMYIQTSAACQFIKETLKK